MFGALSKSVVKSNYKFGVRHPYPIPDYLCNGGEFAGEPAEADMRAVSTVSVDPLLGPETEAFFDLVQSRFELLPPTGMTEGSAAKRCDLDGDDDWTATMSRSSVPQSDRAAETSTTSSNARSIRRRSSATRLRMTCVAI